VAPRPVLSDEEEQQERDERDRLRQIDQKLDALDARRRSLIAEMRKLSAEQKALYDRRQTPQIEVERLYDEHGALGKRLADLRAAREAARRSFEAAVVALRELRLTFAPGERVRPEQLKREIAALEHRQQTQSLSLDDENALIAQLRLKTKELKEAEARVQVVAAHEKTRLEAEAKVAAARAEIDRLGAEFGATKTERDQKMASIRTKLEGAGALVAELRAKGKERAAVMDQIDAVSREMHDLDLEGRRLVGASRARRDEARRTLRAYAPRRGGPGEDALARSADAQLEELLKRGKITLGG
jgi:uncharacterized coiled-coil DUF342 family protein